MSDLQRLHEEFLNSATTLTLFETMSTWRSTGFLDDDCQVWWSRFLPHGGGWGTETPNPVSDAPAFVIRGTDIPRLAVGDLNLGEFRFNV